MPSSTLLLRSVLLLLSLSTQAIAQAIAQGAQTAMPPGISIGMTIEGSVFVDSRGMTLYFGEGRSCNGDHRASVLPSAGGGAHRQLPTTIELPLSCVDKSPPLLAPPNAAPIGRWTLIERSDGARQWAYDGHPLHTSIKDKVPGEANGSYRVRLGSSESNDKPVARAPTPGLPAGLMVRETAAGLVFASHTGKTLYYKSADKDGKIPECREACTQTWKPLYAPELARADGFAREWTVATGTGGVKQWAYDGNPLYTYVYDSEAHGGQLLGDTFGRIWGRRMEDWNIAVALPAPRHPAEVTIQQLPGTWEQFNTPLPTTVYADAKGRTLYTMHCRQGRRSGLSCDDVGDDPRYWLSYCGSEERCARTWRPLPASPGAEAIDRVWSVAIINDKHPFRQAAGGQGVRVWAYRGRPVFTYARDSLPGDYYGDDQSFAITGDGMQARPIPAYASSAEARAPVMALNP